MTKRVGMLVAVCCVLITSMASNGPITVSETKITNDYPETIAFEVEVTSTAATIVSVELNLAVRGEISSFVKLAEFTPAQQVVARFAWKTRRDDVPPGAPIQYAWTIRDEAGNTLPPAERPTVPPAPTIPATPTIDAPARPSGCVPCVGVLGLLSLLAVPRLLIYSSARLEV